MKYEIYQLKPEHRDFLFCGLEDEVWAGTFPCKEMYVKLYAGVIEVEAQSKGLALEDLYVRFNVNRPADFNGHSLSVSDVITLKGDEDEWWSAFFCDRVGFKKLEESRLSPVEEAQNALINRLTQEQNAFRAKLLKMPPTAILDHAAEFALREDILYGFREIWELRPELVRVFLDYQGDLVDYLYKACRSRMVDDLEGLICLCGDGMLEEKVSG